MLCTRKPPPVDNDEDESDEEEEADEDDDGDADDAEEDVLSDASFLATSHSWTLTTVAGGFSLM